MTIMLVGECTDDHLFKIWDADAVSENEFEFMVAKALLCIYPNYKCFVFDGGFRYEGNVSRPDLALIANDFSHWFIIEVELLSHSFDHHVLPQVRAFRYGTPEPDCLNKLSEKTGLDKERVKTFLHFVPYSVAVIANKYDRDWDTALRSHGIQYLTATVYNSLKGQNAIEVSRQLNVLEEHLGFGKYSAVDRALRFHHAVKLPEGDIQIEDMDGSTGIWRVTKDASYAWIIKTVGVPSFQDDADFRLVRSVGGRIFIRPSLK
jgi:hypothetical protein